MKKPEDSRLSGYALEITHPILPLERCFCANCGKPWGWASRESSETIAPLEVIVVCDDCFAGLNPEQKAMRVPDAELVRLGLCEENLRSD